MSSTELAIINLKRQLEIMTDTQIEILKNLQQLNLNFEKYFSDIEGEHNQDKM